MASGSIIATPTQVETFQKTRKVDNRPFSMFEIRTLEGHKLTTMDRAKAEKAHALIGKPSAIKITEKQNGTYVNTYLDDIEAQAVLPSEAQILGDLANLAGFTPAEPLPPPTMGLQAHVSPSNGFMAPAGTFTSPGLPEPVQTLTGRSVLDVPLGPTGRDLSIWRQTATKVAAHVSKDKREFWSNVNELVKFYEDGINPLVQYDTLEELPF